MRLVCRAFAMTVSLALVARWGCPAFAGPAAAGLSMDERQIRLWSDWWVREIHRQYLPQPHLLYVQSSAQDRVDRIFESIASLTPATVEFDNFYRRRVGRTKWDQDNAGRLDAEAIVMPSGLEYINDKDPRYTHWVRPQEWFLPQISLSPAKGKGVSLSWAKEIQAPVKIRPTAFSEAQCEDAAFVRLPFPKENWWLEYLKSWHRAYPFFEIGPND